MSISATDGSSQTCTGVVDCMSHVEGNMWQYNLNTLSAQVWDLDELRNCGGTLQIADSCPDDNEVSTTN